jgi:energy-coupling factor transporter ATP-binding protein EcfA2
MNDNATNVILERHKRIERLVARWDELRRERTTGKEAETTPPEVEDNERREVLWLTSPAPYPGLRSFGPDETALFFARQAQTDGLVQRLAKSNIMVVLGGSGCGKSSLVRAGLIPRLTTSASVPGLKGRWYVVEFRPGLDPSTALVDGFRDSIVAPVARFAPTGDPLLGRRALVKALGLDEALLNAETDEALRSEAVVTIRRRLFGDAEADALRVASLRVEGVFELARDILDRLDIELSRGARAGPPNLLMLIDQFEETFRTEVTPQGQDNLCRLIKETFTQRPPSLFLALTLRSEELHRCAEAGLANIVTETAYLLGPLDDEAARREIIVKPAQAVFGDWIWAHEEDAERGVDPFDPEVVQLLMGESQRAMAGLSHKSDYLPLLQHALLHLWDAAMKRWQKELATDGTVDLAIRVTDLEAIADGVKPDFLVRCLNKYADKARDDAVEKAAGYFRGPDARVQAERVVRTAFSAMARKDDRGNWARRFVTPARVAKLLDDDASDKAAAKEVLRVFKRAGYLNRTGSGKDKKFDVSHEALIRNWGTYNEWLREIGELEHSLCEVANNLENERIDASAAGKSGTALGWFWDWLRETNESRAREVIPDRFREDIGKVVGPAASISRGFAAALLADGERRKSTRLSDGLPPASVQATAQLEALERETLEQGMRGRVEAMAEPWRGAVAASQKKLPRWVIVPSILLVFTAAIAGILWFSVAENKDLTSANNNLMRSRDRLYFGAVAAAGNLDVPRWIEAVAYELERAYDRMDAHRGQEIWAENSSAGAEMSLSVSNWERAARQLTGAIVFRDPKTVPNILSKASCSIAGAELMRQVGGISFGVVFDEQKNSWWPRVKTPPSAGAAPTGDAGLYPLAQRGDMICLGREVPLVMVWPAGQDKEPKFWQLGVSCKTFTNNSCVAWLPDPLLLRVIFAKNYANVRAEPPWQRLWRDKVTKYAGATPWAQMEIYDYTTLVHEAPSRVGFAFKFDKDWLIADTTPGVVMPYVRTVSSDMERVCTGKMCEFDLPSSKLSVSNEIKSQEQKNDSSKCTSERSDKCVVTLKVQSVPSEGNAYLPIWTWVMPGAPVDVITTDGQSMDFRTMDGLWRRGIISVQTLAEHVKLLAGTMTGDASRENLIELDLSEACRKTACKDWMPVAKPQEGSWRW